MKARKFRWYVLIVNPMKAKIAFDSLQMLKHSCLRQIISANDLVGDIKMKSNMIFIEAALNADLQRRVLNIQTIYKFFPSNASPCILKDLSSFFANFSAMQLKKAEEKLGLINDHEVGDAIVSDENSQLDVIQERSSEINLEMASQVGQLVMIKNGPLAKSYGYIKEIEPEKGIVFVEVNIFGNLAITELNISDTKLIK